MCEDKCEKCCEYFGHIIAMCCAGVCTIVVLIACVAYPILKVYLAVRSVVGTEWQNESISNVSMLESFALSTPECHNIDVYFSHISPLFLEVKAPENTGINLTLLAENTTDSQIIDICYAHANEICSVSIGGFDDFFAFVSLDSANITEDVVFQWSCVYPNETLLIILLILTSCACVGILFCLSACICLMVKRFCYSSDRNQASKSYQKLTYEPRKWKLPILSNNEEKQPLLKNVKVADNTTEVVSGAPTGLLLN